MCLDVNTIWQLSSAATLVSLLTSGLHCAYLYCRRLTRRLKLWCAFWCSQIKPPVLSTSTTFSASYTRPTPSRPLLVTVHRTVRRLKVVRGSVKKTKIGLDVESRDFCEKQNAVDVEKGRNLSQKSSVVLRRHHERGIKCLHNLRHFFFDLNDFKTSIGSAETVRRGE